MRRAASCLFPSFNSTKSEPIPRRSAVAQNMRSAQNIRRPFGVGTANSRGRAMIRIETQKHQGRCAPLPPFPKTSRRHRVAPEPGHGGARHGVSVITRTGNHCNRHGPRDRSPSLPQMELGKVICPHKPHELAVWVAPDELCQSIHSVARIEFQFDCGGHNRSAARLRFGRFEPCAQAGHIIARLKRVARRNQPPRCIEAQRVDCKPGDPPVPAMRGIETAPQQANASCERGHKRTVRKQRLAISAGMGQVKVTKAGRFPALEKQRSSA